MRIPDIGFANSSPNIIESGNTSGLAAEVQALQQGSGQLNNLAISTQERERAATQTAQMRAINAKYEADLAKNSATWTTSLGDANVQSTVGNAIGNVLTTVGKVYEQHAKDEAFIKANAQKAMDKSFYLEATTKYEEEMLYQSEALKTKFGGDGKGYTEALMKLSNEKTLGLLKNASSPEAYEKTLYALEGKRLQYLKSSLNFTAERQEQLIVKQLGNAMDSVVKRATLKPDEALTQIDTLAELSQNIIDMGAPEDKVLKAAEAARNQIQIVHIDKQLIDGKATQVMKEFNDGYYENLPPEQYKSALAKTYRTIENDLKEANKLSLKNLHIARVESGKPLTDSKEDKDAFDTVYQESTNAYRDPKTNNLNYKEPLLFTAFDEVIGKNKTYLPTQMKKELEAALKSDNIDSNTFGAKMISYLVNDKDKRHLADDIDANTITKADMINTAMSTGEPIEKAITLTNQKLASVRTELAESRRTQFNDQVNLEVAQDEVINAFEDWKGSNTDNASDAIAQFMTTARSQYILTGDMDSAKKIAINRISKEFGITKINGSKEIMRGAPEVVFRSQDMDEVYDSLNKGVYEVLELPIPEKGWFDDYTPLPTKDKDGNDIEIKLGADYATTLKSKETHGTYNILISKNGGEFVPVTTKEGYIARTGFEEGYTEDEITNYQEGLTNKEKHDIMVKNNKQALKDIKGKMKALNLGIKRKSITNTVKDTQNNGI